MSANRPFGWTLAKRLAAARLADGRLTQAAIAAEAGVTERQLRRWLAHPEFAARVERVVADAAAASDDLLIADMHRRLVVLDDLHSRYLRAIELRAERHGLAADTPEEAARRVFGGGTPPEAATGLFVKEETTGGGGGTTVKWSADTALTKELRAIQEQAAEERGQRVRKHEHSGPGGRPIEVRRPPIDLTQISDEDLEAFAALKAKLRRATGDADPA